MTAASRCGRPLSEDIFVLPPSSLFYALRFEGSFFVKMTVCVSRVTLALTLRRLKSPLILFFPASHFSLPSSVGVPVCPLFSPPFSLPSFSSFTPRFSALSFLGPVPAGLTSLCEPEEGKKTLPPPPPSFTHNNAQVFFPPLPPFFGQERKRS